MIGAPLGIYALMQLLRGRGGMSALLPLILGGGLTAHGLGMFGGEGPATGAAPAAPDASGPAEKIRQAALAFKGDPAARQALLPWYGHFGSEEQIRQGIYDTMRQEATAARLSPAQAEALWQATLQETGKPA